MRSPEDWRREDLRLLESAFLSLSSLYLRASFFSYSSRSVLDFTRLFFFRASRLRLCCRTAGVTRRWILGQANFWRLPSFLGRGLFTTYCLTSSSFDRLNSLRILDARLGPRRRGTFVSVRPGISLTPFLTMMRARTDRLESTMQPLTDFLLRSPSRRGR